MTRPVVGSVAEEMYSSLVAFHAGDEDRGYPLLHYCEAIGLQSQPVRDLVLDTPDGLHIGWSVLLNVDRCPVWGLPYLAQYVGVRIPPSMTDEAEIRAWIKDVGGWRRGRPATRTAALQTILTGSKTVITRERFNPNDPNVDSGGHIQVKTYTSETPDPAVAEQIARTHTMAGLVLHFDVVDGQDWLQAETEFATWGDLEGAFATWGEAEDATP